ncbi:hypothetical protein ACF5W4_01775 [Bacillota bacterium Lsc_1132]
MQKQFETKLANKNIPIDGINRQYCGMMNGEKVREQALQLIEDNNKGLLIKIKRESETKTGP